MNIIYMSTHYIDILTLHIVRHMFVVVYYTVLSLYKGRGKNYFSFGGGDQCG